MESPRVRLVSLTTVVEIQEDRLALVHIPLDLYPFFLNPILQILFHEVSPISENQVEEDEEYSERPRRHQPAFLNFSLTPVECSIMCPRQLANEYFAPLVDKFVQSNSSGQSRLSISNDDFIAMQVYGEGLEAGQRVLELTSPLAMAGMFVQLILNPCNMLTEMTQLHLFHFHILFRLHHRAPPEQDTGDRGFGKTWFSV